MPDSSLVLPSIVLMSAPALVALLWFGFRATKKRFNASSSASSADDLETAEENRHQALQTVRAGLEIHLPELQSVNFHLFSSMNQGQTNLELILGLQISNKSAHPMTVNRLGWELWLSGIHLKSGAFMNVLELPPDATNRPYEIHDVFPEEGILKILTKSGGSGAYLEGVVYCDSPHGRFDKPFTILGLKVSVEGKVLDASSGITTGQELSSGQTEDSVTGMLPRKFLDDNLQTIINANVAKTPISFLMIDVDKFKPINDTYGHLTGDDVLKVVASHIMTLSGTKSTVIRYGGDEFCVILEGVSTDAAKDIAENIRAAVEKIDLHTKDGVVRVTVSIGVATLAENADYKILIRNADEMLRLSKEKGRNCVSVNHRRIAS